MNNKLYNKNFLIILIGQLISLLGNTIQRFAFSLYILDQTGSVKIFSVILSLQIIPTILVAPFGGAIADRMNKGKIMVVLDSICAAILTFFVIFCLGRNHEIIFIGGLMIILSIISSIYDPTVRSSVPAVVPEEKLNAANSLVSQVSAISSLLGPLAAGFLYGLCGIRVVMIINLVSFALSAAMEMLLTIPFNRPEGSAGLKTYARDISDSAVYLWKKSRMVLYVIFMAALMNLVLTPLYTVGVPFIEKMIFDVTDSMYGISEALMGSGMMAGALLLVYIDRKIPFEKVYITFTIFAAGVLGMGLCVTGLVLNAGSGHMLSYILFTFSGFILMFEVAIIDIQAITWIQKHIDNSMTGKVMAFTMALSTALMPVGQLIYGKIYNIPESMLPVIYIGAAAIAVVFVMMAKKIFSDDTFLCSEE